MFYDLVTSMDLLSYDMRLTIVAAEVVICGLGVWLVCR
jgi:hypothetical protein